MNKDDSEKKKQSVASDFALITRTAQTPRTSVHSRYLPAEQPREKEKKDVFVVISPQCATKIFFYYLFISFSLTFVHI